MQHEKVEQFVKFCEAKPPEEEYNWDDSSYCALGQFCGFERWGWTELDFLNCNTIAKFEPQTFGALAERLKLEFNFI